MNSKSIGLNIAMCHNSIDLHISFKLVFPIYSVKEGSASYCQTVKPSNKKFLPSFFIFLHRSLIKNSIKSLRATNKFHIYIFSCRNNLKKIKIKPLLMMVKQFLLYCFCRQTHEQQWKTRARARASRAARFASSL